MNVASSLFRRADDTGDEQEADQGEDGAADTGRGGAVREDLFGP